MQAPTGDLPEAAQRCFNPLSRLRGNTAAGLSVVSVYRLAVTEPGLLPPRVQGSVPLPPFNRTIRHSYIRKNRRQTVTASFCPEKQMHNSYLQNSGAPLPNLTVVPLIAY
jgi:hypothetical protein